VNGRSNDSKRRRTPSSPNPSFSSNQSMHDGAIISSNSIPSSSQAVSTPQSSVARSKSNSQFSKPSVASGSKKKSRKLTEDAAEYQPAVMHTTEEEDELEDEWNDPKPVKESSKRFKFKYTQKRRHSVVEGIDELMDEPLNKKQKGTLHSPESSFTVDRSGILQLH
jgi:hypothetical protein